MSPTDRSAAIRRAALHAAARGWPVFPLVPGGKTPAIRAAHPAGHPCRGECGRFGHGFHDATTDPAVIKAWWRRWPAANYAIATGPAALVVIDLDTGKGRPPARVLPDQAPAETTPTRITDGAGVLAWAATRDGADPGWGDTLTVATPSGGRHLYYAAPTGPGELSGRVVRSSVGMSAGRITGLGWCIDVRAAGGYVVGPGSHGPKRTTDGYAATHKGHAGQLPGWIFARIEAIGAAHRPCITGAAGGPALGAAGAPPARAGYATAALAGELAAIAAARPGDTTGGGRNSTLNRAAYKLGRLLVVCHIDPNDVTARLLEAATAVGLPEREARTAIASGLAQGAAHPRTPTTTPGRRPGCAATCTAPTTPTSAGGRP